MHLDLRPLSDTSRLATPTTNRIDHNNAKRFESALRKAFESTGEVVLDLSVVELVDIAGIDVLRRAHRDAEVARKCFTVAEPTPGVRLLLDITRATEAIPVLPKVPASAAPQLA